VTKGFLLGTNILSELRRPRPAPQVAAFISAQPLEGLFVSSMTFAKIRFGIERVDGLHKRSALTDWLNLALRPLFKGRALPVSEDVMFRRQQLVEEGRKADHTFPQPDLIIAATAMHHGLAVVSRDEGCHAKTGGRSLIPGGKSASSARPSSASSYQIRSIFITPPRSAAPAPPAPARSSAPP